MINHYLVNQPFLDSLGQYKITDKKEKGRKKSVVPFK